MVGLDRTIAHPTPVAWIAGTILGRVPRTRRSARAASHPSTVMVRLDRTIAQRAPVARIVGTPPGHKPRGAPVALRPSTTTTTVMVRLDRTIARRTQVVRSENTRIRVYCATHSVVALTSR